LTQDGRQAARLIRLRMGMGENVPAGREPSGFRRARTRKSARTGAATGGAIHSMSMGGQADRISRMSSVRLEALILL
jgi:hypothetical protein